MRRIAATGAGRCGGAKGMARVREGGGVAGCHSPIGPRRKPAAPSLSSTLHMSLARTWRQGRLLHLAVAVGVGVSSGVWLFDAPLRKYAAERAAAAAEGAGGEESEGGRR